MKQIIMLLLIFSCSQQNDFAPPPSSKSKEALVDEVIELNRQDVAQIKSVNIDKNELNNELNSFRKFLLSEKFSEKDINLIHYAATQKIDQGFFKKAAVKGQVSGEKLDQFIEGNELSKMPEEKKNLIQEISKASKYEENLTKTYNRFAAMMKKVPIPEEKKKALYDKQILRSKQVLYFAHKDTEPKELKRFHYFLTNPAYVKYKDRWQTFYNIYINKLMKIMEVDQKKQNKGLLQNNAEKKVE